MRLLLEVGASDIACTQGEITVRIDPPSPTGQKTMTLRPTYLDTYIYLAMELSPSRHHVATREEHLVVTKPVRSLVAFATFSFPNHMRGDRALFAFDVKTSKLHIVPDPREALDQERYFHVRKAWVGLLGGLSCVTLSCCPDIATEYTVEDKHDSGFRIGRIEESSTIEWET